MGQPGNDRPAGYKECTSLLSQTGFEGPITEWDIHFGQEGVKQVVSPKYTGLFALLAPSFDGDVFTPYFDQQFKMPDWVISSTTELDVSLYKYIDDQGTGADPHDRFYVVVLDAPNLGATMITTPTEVARGDEAKNWTLKRASLPLMPGINLEDYAGQDLYVYFYNNTNAAAANAGDCQLFGGAVDCGMTKFYFDDADLRVCTTQPLPDPITTRLKGKVTVLEAGNKFQTYENDRVWVYSEGGELYQTVTIQGGEFNFFNLPASATGITYYVYAEHVFQGGGGQVEVVANHTTVLLKSNNDYNNPAVTTLVLRDPLP
jgi:hypothetical protein